MLDKIHLLPPVDLEMLFILASKAWQDRWLIQPVEMTDVPVGGEDSDKQMTMIMYRVTVRGHKGYILDSHPDAAIQKAIERWG